MNTPQEEAEEMVTTMTPTELRDILAQYIAVARAADAYWKVSAPEPNYYRKSQDLDNALMALRATGKAEL